MTVIIADVKLPSIKPIRRSVIFVLLTNEKLKINIPNRKAPISALVIIPRSFWKRLIPVIKLRATHKLEPELIPRTYGPANGLLNKVWNDYQKSFVY